MNKGNYRRDNIGMTVRQPGSALILLFSLFAFFLILTPILTGWIGAIIKKPVAALRIAMVVQDLLVFILPAIITALVSTRLPAKLMAVDVRPNWRMLLLSLLTLLASVPAMNLVIEWNQNIHLPANMGQIEQTLRMLEENAAAVTDMLMAGASIPSLIVSVLIVGALAGFSEELFFRGAIQRLIMSSRMNPHAVIWIVSLIFSLFHFQFFGFVPRMLLGAFFGYLLWWSKSLWIPVIVHMFNNIVVVCSTWYATNNPESAFNADKIGTDLNSASSIIMVSASLLLTIVGIMAIRRQQR